MVDIVVKARHMEVTDALKQYVEAKVAKLPRFFNSIYAVEVTLGMEGDKPSAEIVVSAKRKNVFVATHRDEDMYACIDQCLHKLSEQVRRHKDKVRDRHGPRHGQLIERTGQ